MNRFQKLFAKKNARAFMPYFMLGYPNIEESLALIKTAIAAGADALELGLPFSDPIADGPTIQQASQIALTQQINFDKGLALIKEIRRESDIPIALMTYFNLIYRQGIKQAHQRLAQHAVDALITVDLPYGVMPEHANSLREHNIGSIYLITPNTPADRVKLLLEHSHAFTYVVSNLGTTGSRANINPATIERLAQLRKMTEKPLVVGFGVSNADHVKQLHDAGADGVIIASAIIKIIEQHPSQATIYHQEIAKLIHQSKNYAVN